MRIAYFDCFSGAAGDMILGALVAAGLSPDVLRSDLARLELDGYELHITPVNKQGFAATRVEVRLTGKPGHRHLHHITAIIDASNLSEPVKDRSRRIFTRLAEAEAAVHGTTIERVHFHEVGAVDAIVDVVGAVAGLERLGVGRIVCSPIPTGSGTVRCQHGVMPVPAPATAKLLTGVPLAECDEPGELTTPTGAAVLTTLADGYGPPPAMRITASGFGAGHREGNNRPNVLRVLIGDTVDVDAESDVVTVLEANLDDATGEQIGHAFEALFAAGALDVFVTPIFMKKNRPGVMVSVLTTHDRAALCEGVLFRETTTFGVRRHTVRRSKLNRETETVDTPFGTVRMKIGRRGGRVVTASPEYEDCARAARETGAALRDVMSAAQRAWHERKGPNQ